MFCSFLANLVWLLKVSRSIDLVYGGGTVGLMGLVSQAVHDGGRHVLGCASFCLYIPKTNRMVEQKKLRGFEWFFVFVRNHC